MGGCRVLGMSINISIAFNALKIYIVVEKTLNLLEIITVINVVQEAHGLANTQITAHRILVVLGV